MLLTTLYCISLIASCRMIVWESLNLLRVVTQNVRRLVVFAALGVRINVKMCVGRPAFHQGRELGRGEHSPSLVR